MEIEAIDLMVRLEENHWWYVSNRKMIFTFLDKYYPKFDKKRKILDAGCGSGIIIGKLQRYGVAFGIDLSDYALSFCRKRGMRNVCRASIDKIPFKSQFFDIVGCFGVLYHKGVENDIKALQEFYRVCKKGGRVFITTTTSYLSPSEHDRLQHTKRRHTATELRNKLESVGFKIEKISYYNFFIFPVVYARRMMDSKLNLKMKDAKEENIIVNSALKKLMSIEIFLMKYFDLPIGVSLFCIARKPLS